MISDFKGGDGGSKMTPKNWTLEGKNREEGWSKITQKSRKSFMDVPLGFAYLIYKANLRKQLKQTCVADELLLKDKDFFLLVFPYPDENFQK